MRIVFGFVLLLGIGLAGGAVYMAQGYVGAQRAELERERAARAAQVPLVDVFVVNKKLTYGETLTKKDVRLVKWPENAIPQGAFRDPVKLFGTRPEDLRTVLRQMEKDEAVLAVKVSEPGQDAGLTSRLKKGMRAFTIKVDVSSGVSGFLRPDDKVDVYWSGNANNRNFTKLILAGVKIIAIDQTADVERKTAAIARTVTVEISPAHVASLAQAQATGRLSLSLVGAGDNTVADAVQVDQNSLLGIKEEKVVEQKAKKVCTIKTRRGAEVLEIPIPCTN